MHEEDGRDGRRLRSSSCWGRGCVLSRGQVLHLLRLQGVGGILGAGGDFLRGLVTLRMSARLAGRL